MPISLGSAPATSDTAVAPPVSSQLHPRLLSSSGRACVAPAEPSHGEKRPSPPRALSFPGPAWDPAGCGRFSRPRVPEENFGRAGKKEPRNPRPPSSRGGWKKERLETRLPRAAPPVVHEPGQSGAPLPPEPVLRGRARCCLPERGCVRPKPLQHLCIRMCSSLSSLLACALPRSLPTTTPVPGEGGFFFLLLFFFPSAFTSLATVQGPVREAERLAASCIIHGQAQQPWLLLLLLAPAETPSPAPIASGSPRPWGRSRCGAPGLSSPLSWGVGAEKKGTFLSRGSLNGDAHPCAA